MSHPRKEAQAAEPSVVQISPAMEETPMQSVIPMEDTPMTTATIEKLPSARALSLKVGHTHRDLTNTCSARHVALQVIMHICVVSLFGLLRFWEGQANVLNAKMQITGILGSWYTIILD